LSRSVTAAVPGTLASAHRDRRPVSVDPLYTRRSIAYSEGTCLSRSVTVRLRLCRRRSRPRNAISALYLRSPVSVDPSFSSIPRTSIWESVDPLPLTRALSAGVAHLRPLPSRTLPARSSQYALAGTFGAAASTARPAHLRADGRHAAAYKAPVNTHSVYKHAMPPL
jgi:hypothetical protein